MRPFLVGICAMTLAVSIPAALADAPAGGTAVARDRPTADRSAEAVETLRRRIDAGDAIGRLADESWAGVPLTEDDATAAAALVVDAWRRQEEPARRREIESGELRDGDLVMPIFLKAFGEKPAAGHSLWISLHGGGGAPARVNDQQWENQKRLYAPKEGIYVAPRAPTNTWNLWHEAHIDRLFHRLIEDLVIMGDVDPDRVYVLGYSAGGDGVYQLAPRMADHWAAAAMMAGHPNGVSLEPVRNVPFALQVGELDTAYDRARVAADYGRALDTFRKADPGGYEALVKIHAGKGHWMDRDDAVALPWMANFTRNPLPDRVVWQPTGSSRGTSSWLALPEGAKRDGGRIVARREGQTITLEATGEQPALLVRLDDRMLDCDEAVRIVDGEKVLHDGLPVRTIATLVRTLLERGDPRLAFACEVPVRLDGAAAP